ncbi:hypothetical protein [Photobacterium sanguinicancri]|uniref:hypothetical protein n=1 Tax=Photobacterium sanguinicancri TaxID=875932 RepID=UPI0007885BA5|nr:hypothetical protein [Photobacterium sanguinicancri]KXI23542.1 hypothetical protein AS132_06880 [Photobacterium sanguinicancri]
MKQNIQTAYQGELYGIAFFEYFAKHYTEQKQQTLWDTLIAVEVRTAKLIEAYFDSVQQHYNNHDPKMISKGEADAQKWIALPWDELVITLEAWVKPYERQYRDWYNQTEMHSAIELPVFELIAAHETAIYTCWQEECQQKSGIEPLQSFLTQYTLQESPLR